MKLIVLKGEENSGKTITLKRVYERLKQYNVLESKIFKYYDSDHLHNDFRDVLVLDRTKPIVVPLSFDSTDDVKEYDGKSIDDIKAVLCDSDEPELPKNNSEHKSKNVAQQTTTTPEIVYGENSLSPKIDKEHLQDLIDDVKKLNPDTLAMIGFALEGDYGFEHEKTEESFTTHNRNLYNHLEELRLCDIIICACSKLNNTNDPKKIPVNCIITFLEKYASILNITVCVVKSIKHNDTDDWEKIIKDDDSIVDRICKELYVTKPIPKKPIFGKMVTNIGKVDSMEEFLATLNRIQHNDGKSSFFYRGESQDYGATALHPQLFRNKKWVEHEHEMINDYVAKFPDYFPKGTSALDIIVNADHFSLPSRVLDLSYSAFTGLFMACYNFSKPTKVDETKDGLVYIFKVCNQRIKNWNSDLVILLSNLAKMDAKFPDHLNWLKSINHLVHTIKDEKPDYYKMYEDADISAYEEVFNQIVCVKSKMINPRVTNQKGLFFLFGINGNKMNYEDMDFGEGVDIYSITIAGNRKSKILEQLSICGYDRMTMFPDMENVCKNISDNYKN